MTQNKETKEAAFKAWGKTREELLNELSTLIEKYKTAESADLEKAFENINRVCLAVIMKGMDADPLHIIKQLDEIERAVNISKPKGN